MCYEIELVLSLKAPCELGKPPPHFFWEKLKIIDLLGRELAILLDEEKSKGQYNIEFDAKQHHLKSGIYFFKLEADGISKTIKMEYAK